jgi:hypothetical protein
MRAVCKTGLMLLATLISVMPVASCASAVPKDATGLPPARMVATGRAGPFVAATVTVTRTGSVESGGFTGTLDTGTGKSFTLAGPDEPSDFFIVEPRAVLFAPIGAGRESGLIILYDSSRIGPQNGTDHKALVYEVGVAGVTRQKAMEARLAGVSTIAAARAKLGGRR